jgi:hypothetical protein
MRYLIGFACVLALSITGCGDGGCTAPLDAFWLCSMTAAQVTVDDGSFCGDSSFIKSFGPVPSCDADECGRFWC